MLAPCSQKQELMLNSDVQILVLGGAVGGTKSFTLNMIPLRYVDCPDFNGIIFRRTTVQLRGQGGMWDTAKDIFAMLPKDEQPKPREYDLTAEWPNGSKMKYSHMEYVKNKIDHQGLQYTFIGFDEGTHFEFEQIEYLMSRLRSKSKYPSRMVISCNPDPDSWLYEMVEWYLDEEGYPDPEKDGVIRYYIRRDGEFIWSNSKSELIKKYSTKKRKVKPISFSFISSNIYDNPPLMEKNPEYVDFLEGLNKIDKARLLYGNWKVREKGANYFKREDLIKIDTIPIKSFCCRGWDKAATEPSDVNPYPDYTASTKMYKVENEDYRYVITGEYHKANYDKKSETYGVFRLKPGARDKIIRKQAEYDGFNCHVILPQDPGAAGKTEYQSSVKELSDFTVRADPAPAQSSKLTKYSPFSSAVENGIVAIVEGSFDKKSLEAFYKAHESFDGEKSGKIKKDDWPDSTATCYNYCAKTKEHKCVQRNQTQSKTLAQPLLNSTGGMSMEKLYANY